MIVSADDAARGGKEEGFEVSDPRLAAVLDTEFIPYPKKS